MLHTGDESKGVMSVLENEERFIISTNYQGMADQEEGHLAYTPIQSSDSQKQVDVMSTTI